MDNEKLGEAVPCEKCGRPRHHSTSRSNRGQLKTCTFCRQERWRDANREKISATNKEHYKNNREYHIKKADEWRSNNLERHRLLGWHAKLRRKGSTPEYYDAKLEEQHRACALCLRPMGKRRLDQDEDHKRKRPRGLLCNGCNRLVGQYEVLRPRIQIFEAYLLQYEKGE